jgi:hypothetical protein
MRMLHFCLRMMPKAVYASSKRGATAVLLLPPQGTAPGADAPRCAACDAKSARLMVADTLATLSRAVRTLRVA